MDRLLGKTSGQPVVQLVIDRPQGNFSPFHRMSHEETHVVCALLGVCEFGRTVTKLCRHMASLVTQDGQEEVSLRATPSVVNREQSTSLNSTETGSRARDGEKSCCMAALFSRKR